MLEGESREVGVPDEVPGGARVVEQAAQEREMTASRLEHDGLALAEPSLENVGRLIGPQRTGEDRGMVARRRTARRTVQEKATASPPARASRGYERPHAPGRSG